MKTTEKKPTPESRLHDDDQMVGAEDVTQDDSTTHLLWQAFNVRPKLNRAALDVLIAIDELGPTAYQEDIWTHAEMSESTCRRALRSLEAAFLVVTTQRWIGGQTTKNTYQVIHSHRSKVTDRPPNHRSKVTDHEAGQKRPPHDVMHDVEMDKKLELLNFLDWGERLKRAGQKHCTLKFAAAWREWWDRKDFGWRTEPAAWANKQMRLGHQPPPPQMSLPATSADSTQKAWYTADEFERLIEH